MQTFYGDFTGDEWNNFCQTCFKLQYRNEDYQEVPDHFRGDLGIEGFTRTGKVFQCYCPDKNPGSKKLYEKQRGKITSDINKLIYNEIELEKVLGSTRIKRWIFVTPFYENKDLISHCHTKRELIKKKELSIIDPDFDIVIHDLEFYREVMGVALGSIDKKISFEPESVKKKAISTWLEENISGTKSVIRKVKATYSNKLKTENIEESVNYYISNYIKGIQIISNLEKNFQNHYEKYERIKSDFESEVEEICRNPKKNNHDLMRYIESELNDRIEKNFNEILDSIMISNLKKFTISDWLIRCPIEFEAE